MTALIPFGEYLKANIDAGNIDFSMRAKINEEGEVEFYRTITNSFLSMAEETNLWLSATNR